jgi:hypothetical protein
MKLFKIVDLFFATIALLVLASTYFINTHSNLFIYAMIIFLLLSFISITIHLGHWSEHWVHPKRKYIYFGILIILIIMIYGSAQPHRDKYDMSMLNYIVYSITVFGIMGVAHYIFSAIELFKMQKS